MKKNSLRFFLSLLALILIIGLIGCSSDSSQGTSQNQDTSSNDSSSDSSNDNESQERMSVTIMAPSFSPEGLDSDSPALKAIEDYTNMDINLQLVANANYEDRFNVTLASGDLPHIMVAYKTPSFINAARDGAFWDITDYLDDYENLRQANEIVLNNTSIDGRIYGVYRSRPLGRNAATINTEWLDNLGLDIPTTIDEFYEVLRAFTYDDPNQSGQDDTYGMVVSEWAGPWNTMQVWMGAPNKWGHDENGQLKPDFMFDEYREALRFFKKLYDEGLVNEDFAVMDSGQWFDPIVNGTAGVVVDVADQANRLQNRITENYTEDDIILDVFGAVEGPHGLRNLPTAGYHGVLAISRTSVTTEEELRRVLQFLNDLNDEVPQNLAYNGVEGIHHEVNDGVLDIIAQRDGGTLFDREVRDLNQFQMHVSGDLFLKAPQTALQKRQDEVMEANMDIVVANPAEPLISPTYTERGQQLDNIIDDARIKFIVGQIDEDGLDEAIALWLRSGGEEYIAEINEAYQIAQAAQ
ncbi:putative aldouronate transport system substrate-binding protein [Evansella vedderi]|uniref:Aldouronate transport system substrate-binding protein n=1 Tax=Evansella vedderi TaxID=38282 RepID=A0ABU0A1J3_9BACI|nr:extracellular solute-binding protein [Evansella vedderi]MDQ0257353.1 putative aldouronate transport system substrate-binding protein [Evansella vedderi]